MGIVSTDINQGVVLEIKGKHILITGANRGIGRAVAEIFAKDKAHLHLVVRSLDTEFESLLRDLGAASVTVYQVDLADFVNVEKFILKHKDLEIDILFNNAGMLTGGLLENQTMSEIAKMMTVNVQSLIHLTHGFLPTMLRRKSGKIINHASVSALMHFPCATTYAASKAAVWAFTNCLRQELAGTGVSTLLLMTPGVDTRMYKEIPALYAQNLNVSFLRSVSANQYAQMIREAVLEDFAELNPEGFSGVGLSLARYLPKAFEKIISRQFKR